MFPPYPAFLQRPLPCPGTSFYASPGCTLDGIVWVPSKRCGGTSLLSPPMGQVSVCCPPPLAPQSRPRSSSHRVLSGPPFPAGSVLPALSAGCWTLQLGPACSYLLLLHAAADVAVQYCCRRTPLLPVLHTVVVGVMHYCCRCTPLLMVLHTVAAGVRCRLTRCYSTISFIPPPLLCPSGSITRG